MNTATQSSALAGKRSSRGRVEPMSPRKLAARRTTITLSPASQETLERFKSATGTSTSAAIDRIIQRSEPKPSRLKEVNGFLVLDLPARRPTAHFTLEDVKRAEDEMDRENVDRLKTRKKKPATNRNGTRRQ